MIEWIVGAGGIVAAFLMWLRSQRSSTATAPLALPPSPLLERLTPLFRAARAVRELASSLTSEDLRLCALTETASYRAIEREAASMWGVPDREGSLRLGVGPGRQVFVDLRRAVAAVEPDDRRDLAEAGFDLQRIDTALEPLASADAWRDRLLVELQAMEKAAGQVRHQPYR